MSMKIAYAIAEGALRLRCKKHSPPKSIRDMKTIMPHSHSDRIRSCMALSARFSDVLKSLAKDFRPYTLYREALTG